jgi:hypothetical protein
MERVCREHEGKWVREMRGCGGRGLAVLHMILNRVTGKPVMGRRK